jgi:hypothetical protein
MAVLNTIPTSRPISMATPSLACPLSCWKSLEEIKKSELLGFIFAVNLQIGIMHVPDIYIYILLLEVYLY